MSAASSARNLAKPPKRERGRARVDQLLQTAARLFAEKGFEPTTMTEIAEKAGAPIGSLYQFFPTKEALADVLRAAYGNAVCDGMASLRANLPGLTLHEFVHRLVRINLDALVEHPSFPALTIVRGRSSPAINDVRRRLAHELIALLLGFDPSLRAKQAELMGQVLMTILRGAVVMSFDRSTGLNGKPLAEIEDMLTLYLSSRLTGAVASPRKGGI